MTHDYKRNGTTTLFAAFDVLEGKVIGRCMQKHRHQEFIRFLNQIEAQVPAKKAVHVILDNYATHKHPKVRKWLDRHPRFTFHFTPTSSSWLNAVEGFFAKLSKRRLKRGVFRSVLELKAAINRFLDQTNNDPKPFTWTADPRQNRRRRQTRASTVRFDPLRRNHPEASRAGPAERAVRGGAGNGPASGRPYLSVTAAATNFLRPALPALVPGGAPVWECGRIDVNMQHDVSIGREPLHHFLGHPALRVAL